MQRVRIGLTGLCSVFLLVLLAAAIFGLAPKERDVAPSASAATDNAVDDNPKDPLAELGVTPGGHPDPDPQLAPLPPAPAPKPTP